MRACRPLPCLSWLVLPLLVFDMCQSLTNVSHWAHEWFPPKVRLRHTLTGTKITWNPSKKSRKFFLSISHRSPWSCEHQGTWPTALNREADFCRVTNLEFSRFGFFKCDLSWCPSCVLHHRLKTRFLHVGSLPCLSTWFSKAHRIVLESLTGSLAVRFHPNWSQTPVSAGHSFH